MAESTQETKKEKKSIRETVSRSFRDMRGEMKKVVWPTRKQAMNNTLVVLIFMVIMGIVIGVFDISLSALIALVLGRGA